MTNPDQQPPQPPTDGVPPTPENPGYAPPAYGAPAHNPQAAYGASTPQGYPAAPGYAAPAPVPGKGLAIAGLILAIVAPLVGFILSIVARSKLKKAGAPTGMATAGIVIGAILTVVWIIIIGFGVAAIIAVASMCGQLGPGVWESGGVTYTCG